MTRIRLVFIAALSLVALPSMASATPPCEQIITTPIQQLLPGDGESDVPLDTRIWVLLHDYSFFPDPPAALVTLTDEQGTEVATTPVSVIGSGAGSALSFAPDEELLPGATYRVDVAWDDRAEEHLSRLEATFTTGQDATGAAPPVPEASSLSVLTQPNRFEAWSCYDEPTDRATVEISSTGRINLLVEGEHEGPTEDPYGTVGDVRTDTTLTIDDELPPATRVALRVGTLDLAGNFSGWSEPIETTMPAAGCASTIELDQAALAFALLLVGGGLLRGSSVTDSLRKGSKAPRPAASQRAQRAAWRRALLPLLLAAAFALPTLAPDAATAAEVEVSVKAPDTTPDDWRAPLVRQLKTTEYVWGGALAATGGVQLGFAIGLPFRAPGALSGTVATPMAWGGALSGLLTARFLRHALMRTESPERLRRALLAGYLITAPLTGVAIGFATAGFILAAMFVDNGVGVSVGLLGVPMSLLSMNITLGVYAEKLRLMKKRGAVQNLRPRPEVLAAGPTGIVIAF